MSMLAGQHAGTAKRQHLSIVMTEASAAGGRDVHQGCVKRDDVFPAKILV